jgi:putative hydrolase of the HAD superfamily
VIDPPHTIIFDMGNVILPFDPLKPCAVLAESVGLTPHQVARQIYDNNLERWFEAGVIDGRKFTDGVASSLGLDLDCDSFRALWADMFSENEEVSRIVRELKGHHRLILLSNTNPWHWKQAVSNYSIISEFEDRVLSFEERVLKPHPAIYRAALDRAGRMDGALFIDDMPINVAGAEILGITGVLFRSASRLRKDLRACGCRL